MNKKTLKAMLNLVHMGNVPVSKEHNVYYQCLGCGTTFLTTILGKLEFPFCPDCQSKSASSLFAKK